MLTSLPEAFRSGLVVIVEPHDSARARLTVSVDTGSPVDEALYGASGWTRVPTLMQPHHTLTPQHRRPQPQTYWCWVVAEEEPALPIWPGPQGDQPPSTPRLPVSSPS